MKQATCKQLRGACDEIITGETPDEMGDNCRTHVMQELAKDDEAHKAAVNDMMLLSKEEQEKWHKEFEASFPGLPEADSAA